MLLERFWKTYQRPLRPHVPKYFRVSRWRRQAECTTDFPSVVKGSTTDGKSVVIKNQILTKR
jgi:hypothetical protein